MNNTLIAAQTVNRGQLVGLDADGRAVPARVTLIVDPEWARLLTRLQQLRKTGATVVLDLEAMTLRVVGKVEAIAS